MRIPTLTALLMLGCGGASDAGFEQSGAGTAPTAPAPQPTLVVMVVDQRFPSTGGSHGPVNTAAVAPGTPASPAASGGSESAGSAGAPQEATGGNQEPVLGGASGAEPQATGELQAAEAGAPPSTGGAITIATGGAVSTGGLSTGGLDNTGGLATGGVPTGGASTGGTGATGGLLETGGAPTGGVPASGGVQATGGYVPTGGASTGGQTSRCNDLAAVGLEDGACSGTVVLSCTEGSGTKYSWLLPAYSADEVLNSVRASECAVAEWEYGEGWTEGVVAKQGDGIVVYRVEDWGCNSQSGHPFAVDVVGNNARLWIGCSSGYPEGEGPMSTVLVELSFPE